MAARLPTANGWSIVQQELPAAGDGEFVVEVDYLSIDPAMRVWMNAGYLNARKKIDEVMRSTAIGTVNSVGGFLVFAREPAHLLKLGG